MKFCRNGTRRYNPILSLSFSLATRALIQAWSPKRFFCDPGCAQSDVSDSPGCRPLPQKSFSGDDTMRYWGRERWLAVMIALCTWWAGNNYHALKTKYIQRRIWVKCTIYFSLQPWTDWGLGLSEFGTEPLTDYCAFLQFLLIRLSAEAINLPLHDWADFGKLPSHDSAIGNLKSPIKDTRTKRFVRVMR